jgi:hypothetical protein
MEEQIENKIIYIINGIRRSGNHAIANWIMSHYNSGCYINNANKFIKTNSNWLPCFSDNCQQKNIQENPEIIIIGLENKLNTLANIPQEYSKKWLSINSNINITMHSIFLIRSFPNLLASSIKAWPKSDWLIKLQDYWKQYVQFALSNNKYILLYDKWLEKQYRDQYAINLDFSNKDTGIDKIPHYGGGSSFKDKLVNNDNLKNRWQMMLDNQEYIEYISKFKYWEDHIKLFGKDQCYYHFMKN